MSNSSYRTILRASSLIGGAQIVNIATGLLKMKVVAVLLGPAGVGMAGLYLNLIQTASSIMSLGLGSVGTRQIAAAHADGGDEAVSRARRALFVGITGLAVIGAVLFWLSSSWIARVILADERRAADVAWLSIGVALTVAATSQIALLTGLRRIGDLAQINVVSGLLSAIFSTIALWLWGTDGLVAMVLTAPIAAFLLGHIYVKRLGPVSGPRPRLSDMIAEWRGMAALGFAFMLSSLVGTLGFLAARTLVQRGLGTEALGHFQASWAIGMTYIGFVLGAMGTDYYPRLTAIISDRQAATKLVNEQTEVALLLCAPVVLAMLGFAPWVIRVLYSADFAPAVEILRWQLLADILKVMSWPLGFVILASGAGRTFVLTESAGMAVFVLGVFLGLPRIGITATGVSFLALYAVYLPLVWWVGRRIIGFRWTSAVKRQVAVLMSCALAVDLIGRMSDLAGAATGALLATAMALWAVVRLSTMTGAGGRLGQVALVGERVKRWMSRRA